MKFGDKRNHISGFLTAEAIVKILIHGKRGRAVTVKRTPPHVAIARFSKLDVLAGDIDE